MPLFYHQKDMGKKNRNLWVTQGVGQRLSNWKAVWFMVACAAVMTLNGIIPGFAAAQEALVKELKKTIVFDPGHGGNDTGAKGPDGTFEKTATLSLARMIEERLGKKYRVQLSRTDDYDIDITERTAVANHLNADLFISIHTGGSSVRKISGISVFCFSEKWAPVLKPESDSLTPEDGSDSPVSWDQMQNRHKATSGILAGQIGKRLADRFKHRDVRIQGAPILVLEGADMPAVLIEIGYLTNPADEKSLADNRVLQDFVQAIGSGIDDFFMEQMQE